MIPGHSLALREMAKQGYSVTFLPAGKKAAVPLVRGKATLTILEAARKAGVEIPSVCGGEGNCGKCKVRVKKGKVKTEESALISEQERRERTVLACQTYPLSDITVEIPVEAAPEEARILTGAQLQRPGIALPYPKNPLVKKIYLEIEPPRLETSIADHERVRLAIRQKLAKPNLPLTTPYHLLLEMPHILRKSDWRVTATLGQKENEVEILALEPGDTTSRNFGLAVDVGTTTIVVHLVDVANFQTVDVEAKYNSQARYGEDYIRRIIYAEENNAFDEMKKLVLDDINSLSAELTKRNRVKKDEVTAVVAAGNTAMLHFLLGLDPTRLRREPYIPSATFIPPLYAREVGLSANRNALFYALPSVSAYVGADITGGAMSLQLDTKKELYLFIDIGTNGEVVLGDGEFMVTCSCSAGPAFEGSGVEHGMRAGAGAIERVKIEAPSKRGAKFQVECKTIGDRPAVGICGSGLLDAIAELFKSGLLNRSGKFASGTGGERIRERDRVKEFILAPKEESGSRKDIVITENDIAHLLRSKAAVYAAITILVEAMSVRIPQVKHIYLAGAFGNYLNVESAVTIGMLPDVERSRMEFVGNTSVSGARTALLSKEAYDKTSEVASKMTYFDLMGNLKFMDEFMKANFLPHTDLSQFPSVRVRGA
jgi:uncharacterized 2Fe-2S/4Fe-4S cluster protein (DUF4445 family)